MFDRMQREAGIRRGDFFLLFRTRDKFLRYLASICIGLPVWFCIGILIKFALNFAALNGVTGSLEMGIVIMWTYVGLSSGDLLSGLLSQLFRSRRKVIAAYLLATCALVWVYIFMTDISAETFYFLCFLIGFATGYWALFVSVAAEQFGTNIRATVTTTVPNFVRGAVIPITLSYKFLEHDFGSAGSALIVGGICMALALWGTWYVRETFAVELDYHEHA
jgi:hypothetical protein